MYAIESSGTMYDTIYGIMVSDIVLYQRHYATADYHHHEYSGTEGGVFSKSLN